MSIGALLFAAAIAAGLSCAAPPALAFGTQSPVDAGRPSGGSGFGFSIPGNDSGFGTALPEQPAAPLPEVHYDLSTLPPAVAAMRDRIVAAARSGDEAEMRRVIGLCSPPPTFSSTGDGASVSRH